MLGLASAWQCSALHSRNCGATPILSPFDNTTRAGHSFGVTANTPWKLLPAFATSADVSTLTEMIHRDCIWRAASHLGAEDCNLPVRPLTPTALLAARLLERVIPKQCEIVPYELPVRRFRKDSADHADAGPSWTLLLHLSHGATAFVASKGAVSGRREVVHTPGDAIMWKNTGHGPLHSTRLLESGDKLMLNVGIFADDLLSCRGIHLQGAGCGPPSALWIGFGYGMLLIAFAITMGIVCGASRQCCYYTACCGGAHCRNVVDGMAVVYLLLGLVFVISLASSPGSFFVNDWRECQDVPTTTLKPKWDPTLETADYDYWEGCGARSCSGDSSKEQKAEALLVTIVISEIVFAVTYAILCCCTCCRPPPPVPTVPVKVTGEPVGAWQNDGSRAPTGQAA